MRNTRTRLLATPAKYTTNLSSQSVEHILFFARRFVANVDWIQDLLSLLNKLIQERTNFTHFERMIVKDYLQLTFIPTATGITLRDRCGHSLSLHELIALREQIRTLCEQYAKTLLKTPRMHPLARAFKQVLAKVGYNRISEEDGAILREAYLQEKGGRLYTLQGNPLELPALPRRLLWKLTG